MTKCKFYDKLTLQNIYKLYLQTIKTMSEFPRIMKKPSLKNTTSSLKNIAKILPKITKKTMILQNLEKNKILKKCKKGYG